MKKHLAIVAAAAFALGGVSLTWAQDAPADRDLSDRTKDAASDVGDKTKDAAQDVRAKTAETVGIGSADQASQHQSANAEAIHDVMAQVAEAALTKDGLDDIAERLVDADRNRLGQGGDDALKNDEAMNNQIDQLARAWKDKYTNEFDIKDEDKVYSTSFAMISEGETGDRARTAGETITGDATKTDSGAAASGTVGGVGADAKVDTDAGTAKVDVDNNTGVDAPKVNTDGQTAADTNRNDPGRNKATVKIAASHGLPELEVPMIHEAGGWKFDIPDTIDAAKFKSNLNAALTDISSKKDQWPQEADEAYRHVTHRVLAALYDKAPDAGAGAGQSQ
jgi:PBP1b-binding outer membrane lipoprotein LpoB